MLKRELQKNVEEKWIEKKPEEKTGWNENEEKQGRKTKVELVPHAIKMIIGLITQKHSLGLFILFFGTPNPGLHYVL